MPGEHSEGQGELPENINRPGGGIKTRPPIEMGGVYYDPLHPPKLYTRPDGQQEYRGGKVLDKDEAYSMMFWGEDQPPGLRETMVEIVNAAIKTGEFASFVGATKPPEGNFELNQASKMKLSAYRILAKEKGYTIDPFQYHENSGTVTAAIHQTAQSSN
jgi:hypothetical protein